MTTEQIAQLDSKYYMNTFGPRFPICFESGSGYTLYDNTGKAYMDFFGGIAVNCLGYAHPAFTEALCNQVKKYIHISNLYYVEQQALLAQRLVENSCLDRVFFANSGAEANEGAIKLARKFFYEKGEERYEIITAQNSFHGRTMATLGATGQEKYQKPFVPLPPSFVHVPFGSLEAARQAISGKTCAIMLETIQGEGGVIAASRDYIQGIETICRQNNLLFIIDEIQTGIGRTGKLFSYEHYDVKPDIITIAKALGNGVPIGALLAKETVASAFYPGDHGSTFGGNALSCTAGLAVMQELLEGGLLQSSITTGNYFKDKLLLLQQSCPKIQEVRGQGLLLGLALSDLISAKDIVLAAMEQGFLIGTAGGNTLRFAPPLIISPEAIDKLCDCLTSLLQ